MPPDNTPSEGSEMDDKTTPETAGVLGSIAAARDALDRAKQEKALEIRKPNWTSHTEEGDKYTMHFPDLPPGGHKAEAWLLKAHLVGKCVECGHEIKTEVRLRPMDLSLEGVKVEEPHV